MRGAFINTLSKLAKKNTDIFLLTGDLGYSVIEGFQKDFPRRFFNIGVAEANMAGIAAGLALSGKTVFMYSIVPFVTMRCFEQVRNDICIQNLKVRIIGAGGGLCYGSAGPTHHSIEDISIMRSLPNMTVICPGDPLEAELAVRSSENYPGPVYIRLGKSKESAVHAGIKGFKIGKGILINEGRDVAIIATGNMLHTASQVTKGLVRKGISACLISMHTVKPIDKDIIRSVALKAKAIFTVEEHSVIGGLGSAVSEVLAEEGKEICFMRIGLPDAYTKEIGSQEYLRSRLGLSANDIERRILEVYRKRIKL
ncbi:1-deoxy-D-xylulose-5-phosphate synthase [bacterium]|nr:MAG: 1-deoxy-D-xylulose-5-phosphate synthase [bacterium]